MRPTFLPLFICTLILCLFTLGSDQSVRAASRPFSKRQTSDADVARRDAIKEAFLYNYGNYVKYAFGFDILNAADKVGENESETAGFGGTIVDALSTMVVMGLTETEEYRNALAFIRQQDFTNTTQADEPGRTGSVQVFELTIRYLGGLLSAFQLNGERAEERFLVDKAKSLADALRGAWYLGRFRIPLPQWNINTQKPVKLDQSSNLAQAGTLTMEWATLSKYTGDSTYRSLTEGTVDVLRSQPSRFPGLPFTSIFPVNESTTSTYITIGGGFDSYLEYLLKYPILLGQRDHRFIESYTHAVNSIQQHLSFKSGSNNFTFLADWDDKKKLPVYLSSHLACFIGANVAMAGRTLERDDWTQLGLEFTESCAGTYANTALHLGPYGFGYADQTGNFTGWNYVSKIQRKFWSEKGFFVSVGYWFVAPEVLESIFYAYRITGQAFWRTLAWDIFQNIKAIADTGLAYAPVVNVNDESSGILGESPTFLYAETLKYLYLIFDDSSKYSLDDFVFTTEGHPLRRPASSFGKIQGAFPYVPVTMPVTKKQLQPTVSNPSTMSANDNVPPNVVLAQPGSSAKEFAVSLHSLTGIPHDIVLFNLRRCMPRQ